VHAPKRKSTAQPASKPATKITATKVTATNITATQTNQMSQGKISHQMSQGEIRDSKKLFGRMVCVAASALGFVVMNH